MIYSLTLLELVTYLLPAVALLSAWTSAKSDYAFVMLLVSMCLCLYAGVHSPVSTALLLVLLSACLVYAVSTSVPLPGVLSGLQDRSLPSWLTWVAISIITLLALVLVSHQVPGINNIAYTRGYVTGADAVPLNMMLNFDKSYLAVMLALFCVPRARGAADWGVICKNVFLYGLILIPVVIVLAWGFSYVRLDPKVPDIIILWAINNLFYVCIAEEIFFRGVILQVLARLLTRYSNAQMIAVVGAGLLFGLAHLAGGVLYVVVATVAGIAYGMVFVKTRRIEASILLHFCVNAVHFLFFTYPALSQEL